MKWLLFLTLAAAVAVVVSWQLFRTSPRAAGDTPGEPAGAAPGAPEVQGIGHVEPVSEVRKLMMRTGGVVKRCHVKAGDTVREGAPLLELEDGTQRAEVEVARLNLELARAEGDQVNVGINPYKIKAVEETVERLREKLRHSRTEAERYGKLVAGHAASNQDHEATATQLRQAEIQLREQEAELLYLRKYVTPEQRALREAKVRHAQANLELAEERLRETQLVAPFDGTVLKLLKREGEGMSTLIPEPVAVFGDLSRLRVRAEVDERFCRRLAVGQAALVFGRNLGGKSYPGRVVEVEKVMGDKTAFTRASSERKDLNVLQVVVALGPEFRAPAGLQVDVKVESRADPAEGE
jgi:multidrug resistance efflux pump